MSRFVKRLLCCNAVAACLASPAVGAETLEDEAELFLLSFPASAGEAEYREATVAFKSNGYWMGPCTVVKSSGDPVADKQACRTSSFFKTDKPLYSTTLVWLAPKYDGAFIPPENVRKKSPVTGYDYPLRSMEKGDQGTVTVKLLIDNLGEVETCHIAQSSGHSQLDAAACNNLKKRTKFKPAELDGAPVASIGITGVGWGVGSPPPNQ